MALVIAKSKIMDNAKEEYFELLRQLNKSNKTKNEATHVSFTIGETNEAELGLFASVSRTQKILLCLKNQNRWKPAGYSRFDKLEELICDYIGKNNDTDTHSIILRNLFKHTE